MQTTLFIDGENFLHKVEDILCKAKLVKHKTDITKLDIQYLIRSALTEYRVSKVIYYGAKVKLYPKYPDLLAKSKQVVEAQRRLKRNLTNQGIDYLICGLVRLYAPSKCKNCSHVTPVFKEKGVDVKMAVDAITFARDHIMKRALICSSDSDMKPMIAELQRQKVQVAYVGFMDRPNGGLTKQCDATVLFRDSEIIESYKRVNKSA